MIFKDYYKILGLDDNKVTIDEIKSAYREQAKKYHPDVNSGDERIEERFKDIAEAYRNLSDIASRRKYDKQWNNYIGKKRAKTTVKKEEKKSVSDEFVNMFFGSVKESNEQKKKQKTDKVPVKGDNIETAINVSIEEAFYGMEKKLKLRTIERKYENIYY